MEKSSALLYMAELENMETRYLEELESNILRL